MSRTRTRIERLERFIPETGLWAGYDKPTEFTEEELEEIHRIITELNAEALARDPHALDDEERLNEETRRFFEESPPNRYYDSPAGPIG